ncbi:PTS sugar transporter subunit IIA [[Clostridium] colinum]|uniref:PTS sugar transporter subunit IIA n=1 Tax=[Clostridium] colinum TaxID=36835 RepID=UPI0020247E7D|nr:PTS sugar transporter subunit IIA [[Clostridium] colinum]
MLKQENIFLNLKVKSKEEAIKLAGEKLFEKGYIEKEYIETMLEREKLMTTFMGMGVAIPHGTNEGKKFVKKSAIVLLQFPEGVDFDGEKAYIVIGICGVGDEHLEILSKIAILLDDELTDRLKNETNKEIFVDTFR